MEAKPTIFLSYAGEDREKVKDLYRQLSDAGYKPWMDKIDLIVGQEWEPAIKKAIREADFFVACLSKQSVNKRGFVQKENKEALDIWKEKMNYDIYFIPVKLEECEVPEEMNRFHWVEVLDEEFLIKFKKAIEKGRELRTQKAFQGELPQPPPVFEAEPDSKPAIKSAPALEPIKTIITNGVMIAHYKIIKKLGEGGMGEVYLAHDTKLKRQVALKLLPREFISNQDLKRRFQREAQALAQLNHPNVVAVYGFDDSNDPPYIIMEYVDGSSLRESIPQAGMPVKQAINFAIQICEGLGEAHHAGIVHRDLKPSNILIHKNDRVKIADFGIAKLPGVTPLTEIGFNPGTPGYKSPEQVKGENLYPQSDIFSFGVVLFEMFTRRLPFQSEFAILNEQTPALAKYRPEIPAGIQNIVNKALKKKREARYENIDKLLEDLRKLPEPPKRRYRLIAALGRYRLIAAIAAFALIAMVFILPFLQNKNGPSQVTKTTLSITALPDNAAVFLNGKAVGATPIGDLPVTAGKNTLRLQKPGYLPRDTMLVIPSNQATNLFFTLEKISLSPVPPTTGGVRINSSPTDAMVWLNNKIVGKTPFEDKELKAGRYRLQISAESYDDVTDSITVRSGQITTFEASFTALGGLRITSKPESAEVFLSGKKAGLTPYQDSKLPVGRYNLVLQKEGYKDYPRVIVVEHRQVSQFNFTLVPRLGRLEILVKPFGSISIDDTLRRGDADFKYAIELAAGPHRVEAVHPSLGRWKKEVTIEPDKTLVLPPIDFRRKAKLTITSVPLGGEIYIDDEPTGDYTPKEIEVRIGLRKIAVRRQGYILEAGAKTLNIDEDIKTPLKFTLRSVQ